MTKRIIALLLALILTVGLLPTVALAAGGDTGKTTPAETSALAPADKYYKFDGGTAENKDAADITLSKTAVDNGNGTYTVTLEATAKTKVQPKPTEVVFVLDASGSMAWCCKHGFHDTSWGSGNSGGYPCEHMQNNRNLKSRWDTAKSAIQTMVANLSQKLGSSVTFKYVVFDDNANVCNNKFQIERNGRWYDVTARGSTHLKAGVQKGIGQFSDDPDTVKALIIVADGDSNDGYPIQSANNFKNNGGTIYTVGFMFKNDDFDSLASDGCKFNANNPEELTTAMGTIESKIIGMIDDPLGDKVDLVANSLQLVKDDTSSTQPDPTTKDNGRTITWTDKSGMTHVKLTYTVKLKDGVTTTVGKNVVDLNGNATFNYSYKQGNTTVSKSLSFPKPQATVYVASLAVNYVDKDGNPINVPGAYSEIKQLPATFTTTIPTVGSTVTVGSTTYYVKSVTGDKDKANAQLNATEVNAKAHTITVVLTDKAPTANYIVKHYLQNLTDDGYTLDETETKAGTTGAQTEAVAKSYPGFTVQSFNQQTIAADGTTVVEIHYNRNTYKVTYDYGKAPAGASALPTEATYKYGETVTVATKATASGYDFDGWKKDGTVTTSFEMPAQNVTLTGSWTQTQVPVDLSQYIQKSLVVEEGSNLPDNYEETFTFDVFIDDAEGPQSFSVTMAEAGTNYVDKTGTISLTVGLHTFTVREAVPTTKTPGMTYDTTEKTFALMVNADGTYTFGHVNEGEFAAEQNKDDQVVIFTNTYTQPSATFDLNTLITKTFEKDPTRESKDIPTGTYTFTAQIFKADDTWQQVEESPVYTGTATLNGAVSGAAFDFDSSRNPTLASGTHRYLVKEEHGGETIDGITYDPTVYHLTITVNEDGTQPNVQIEAEPQASVLSVQPVEFASKITFTNTYFEEKDPTKCTIDFSKFVKKELTATGSKTVDEATFIVDVVGSYDGGAVANALIPNETQATMDEDVLNTTLTATIKNIVGGNVYEVPFNGYVTVSKPGPYTFTLTEHKGTQSGVTYDETRYQVSVNVEQIGDNLVIHDATTYLNNEQVELIKLVNDVPVTAGYIVFKNTIDTGKDDYYPIIIPTIINKDTGMLNKTDHFAYVIGYPDGTVHPNGQITRAEVATIFFRLLRDEVRDGAFTTSNTYSDVAYGKWYNNPISTMSALGIITGYPDGTFKPNKPITRAEFAAIAARFDETQSGKSATFSDVIGHWAAKEIGIAYYNDWIKGYPDGTFKPDQNITRAEAMTLINRVLERKPESPADLLTNMNKWTDNLDTSKWYYLDVQEATNSHGYTRKTFNYELWRQMLPDPDWSRYER